MQFRHISKIIISFLVKTYYTEDTPHISNAPSLTNLADLQGGIGGSGGPPMTSLEPKGLVSGLETPASEGPQLYATESTPGQLSRSDSFNELGMVSRKILIITIFGQIYFKR